MIPLLKEQAIEQLKYRHIIGRLKGKQPGPTLVIVGGIHGNEPSGVQALETVMADLEGKENQFKGEIFALAGNLRALKEEIRFVDRDLNRMWRMRPNMKDLEDIPDAYEKKEMLELHDLVQEIIAKKTGPLVFLDLHTTSSDSPPFLICGDTLRNRDFISEIPVPVILGLDEALNGPFLSYLNAHGHITSCFEAGEHESPDSYHNHVAMIWLMIQKSGCLPDTEIKDYDLHFKRLKEQAGDKLQGFFEVRYRHAIGFGERFTMKPGYRNFQEIELNEPLAQTANGPLHAIVKGRIFMPLYQKQGEDGYFIVTKIPQRRIRRSVFLRKLRFQRFLPLIPGISRHPTYENMLVVTKTAYRRLGPHLLHVLGFRRMSRLGDRLLFIKRPYDLKGPNALDDFPQ